MEIAVTKQRSESARASQRLANEIWRATNKAAAFSRTSKILKLACDSDLSGLDMLGDAIGAECLHRILSHGASHKDVKLMRDFVRLRGRNSVRRTKPASGEVRLRELEARRSREAQK